MKVLNKIKSENLVTIDIETVRLAETFDDLDAGTQSAWEYKNKQDGKVPDNDELAEKWEQYSSLYAEFSKVCAVSLAFLHNGILYCKEFYGEDEREILLNLGATLENIFNRGKEYRLAGHAAKYFDYPYLVKRFIINGMDIPSILDTTDAKPWEQMNLCTNELWKVGGTGPGSSLQALCNMLQVPVSKVDLVGDEVGKAFYNEEYERIGRYCSYDTVATFNVLRRFKKEPIFEFDDVKYIQVKEEKKEETPPLKKLYETDYLSDEIKEQLRGLFKKKKATKKDKEFLQEVLENVYIRTTFMASDGPDTVASKKAEIEDFLKTV